VLKHFSIKPPENYGGAEKSTEYSGSRAKNFFCSMYEMSQRHSVWVKENHVNPCNSASNIIFKQFRCLLLYLNTLQKGISRLPGEKSMSSGGHERTALIAVLPSSQYAGRWDP
jgi:hypothetical protein